MKNYTLILLLAIALLVNGEYSYASHPQILTLKRSLLRDMG